MAKVDLSTLKNWFKTGFKPTQVQFWNMFDSFFHKDDTIPSANIENFDAIMLEKADAEALTNHKIDVAAHATEFGLKVDKVAGKSLSTFDYDAAAVADVAKIQDKADRDAPNFTGEVQFAAYPESRDDGVIPNNRLLGVDATGAMKLYKVPTISPPFLLDLIPDSSMPNSTGNFTLKGMGFVQGMTVLFEGQTVNYITVISSSLAYVNATMGSLEGYFDITVDNGVSITFPDVLFLTQGTVFAPTTAQWTLTEPINVNNDEVNIQTYNSFGTAEWNKEFNYLIDFSIRFNCKASPLGTTNAPYEAFPFFEILKVSDNTQLFYLERIGTSYTPPRQKIRGGSLADGANSIVLGNGWNAAGFWGNPHVYTFDFKYIAGVMYVYVAGILYHTSTAVLTENMKLKIKLSKFDIYSIKYIELP